MLLVKRTTNPCSTTWAMIVVSSVDRIAKRLLEQILQLCFQSSNIQQVRSVNPVTTQTQNKLRPPNQGPRKRSRVQCHRPNLGLGHVPPTSTHQYTNLVQISPTYLDRILSQVGERLASYFLSQYPSEKS